MARPLMPKATAVWLVENTTLTFRQIAAFCGLHELEVQAIADDEVAIGMQGMDPIGCGELTPEEIERCTADPSAELVMAEPSIPIPKIKQKGARYTPVSKRQDRPDAIAWLLKNYEDLSDAQISRLVGTTKPTINSVRERTHWNMPQIKPRNPVGLGLCSSPELEKMVAVASARAATARAAAEKAAEKKAVEKAAEKKAAEKKAAEKAAEEKAVAAAAPEPAADTPAPEPAAAPAPEPAADTPAPEPAAAPAPEPAAAPAPEPVSAPESTAEPAPVPGVQEDIPGPAVPEDAPAPPPEPEEKAKQ